MNRHLLSIAFIVLLAPFLAADQVQLKNGDRISGTILKSDAKELLLKTEASGDIKVSMGAIDSYSGEGPFFLDLADGKTMSGKVKFASGQFEVEPAGQAAVTFPAASVLVLRSKDMYEAEVKKYETAGMFDLWGGFVEAGLSLARGNTETTNFAVGASATRTALKNKTSLYFNSLYASSESETTANSLRGGGRYESNLTDRFLVFGFSDLEHDQFQDLDLRWVAGGGFGWYLVKQDRSQFQVFGGASYNYENFSDDTTRNSAEALAGQQLDYKFNDRFTLAERFTIFPNLSDTGQYRMNFDSSFLTKINNRFGWYFTVSDRYLSNPVAENKKNDLVLTTGVRFTY